MPDIKTISNGIADFGHGPSDEERKRAGYQAAKDDNATTHKPVGQTSPEVHPYTYWWVIGYNSFVDES